MKILFNNILNIQNMQDKKSPKIIFGNLFSPANDVFEKSTYEDDSFIKTCFADEELPEELEMLLRQNIAMNLYFQELGKVAPVFKISPQFYDEYEQNFLKTLSPNIRTCFKNTLKKAGVNDAKSAISLSKIFRRLLDENRLTEIDGFNFLEICGELKEPKEVVNFIEILNGMHMPSAIGQSTMKMQDIVDSLKMLGFKHEKEFFKKFAHLKPKFNDFKESEDKVNLFRHVLINYYAIKDTIKRVIPLDANLNPNEIDIFYINNAQIIDYLYETDEKNFPQRLNYIMRHLLDKTPITPTAKKVYEEIDSLTNENGSKKEEPPANKEEEKAKKEIGFYEFLQSYGLTISELNTLVNNTCYGDTRLVDLVINRDDAIDALCGLYDCSIEHAKHLYLSYAETFNSFINDETTSFFIRPELNLFLAAEKFNLKNDKDFLKFYSDVNHLTKSNKGKKQTVHVRQKDISEFINLLSFLDDDLIARYKKDKNYPLKDELLRRKSEFAKVYKEIEAKIDAKNARYLFHNSYDAFVEYYSVYKASKHVDVFLDRIISIKEKEIIEQERRDETYPKILILFKDKKLFQEFLIKNGIKFDGKNRRYNLACLRILKLLLDGKNEKEASEIRQKILNTDFIKNSQKKLVNFTETKTDEELKILLDIILEKNISSIAELKILFNPYFDKEKKIDKVLAHFASQNMSLDDYLEKLSQVQKSLNNNGINVRIDNSNISQLDLSQTNANRLNALYISIIAKSLLNPNEDGNFICGLNNGLVNAQKEHPLNKIIKELEKARNGVYNEDFGNLCEKLGIDLNTIMLLYNDKPPAQKNATMHLKALLKPLSGIVNSQEYLPSINGKKPNLSLHAKMRLFDRFIAQENIDIYSKKAFEEVNSVLKTIYTSNPTKIESNDDAFSVYFKHEDYEIKAVFEKSGRMITIAKNKL